MKTTRCLITIIACGALTIGRSYADEPARHSTEQDLQKIHAAGVLPAKRLGSIGAQTVRKNSQVKDASRTIWKIGQSGRSFVQGKYTSVGEPHQPALKKSSTAARAGLMLNKIVGQQKQFAKLSLGGAAALSPGVVHGRSTTAAVGELAPSSVKHSAAALDGATVKRKP